MIVIRHHRGHIEIQWHSVPQASSMQCGTKRLHLLAGRQYLHLILKGAGISKYARFRYPR